MRKSVLRHNSVQKQTINALSHRIKPKAIALAVATCFAANVALANPTAPTVVSGTASFATAGNILNITNSHNAIINWGSFSIGVNELTKFIQPSALSAVLNRVTGQDPSAILGALQSNGRVFLLNPNGIVFGAGSQINVAGLVASTLNLSDSDFLAGRMRFTDGAGAGSVVNNGNITGGSVYLVGNAVTNNGLITSPGGEVVLAAGNSVELVNPGTPNLRVEIIAPDNEARNLGTITVEAGRIGIYAGLITNSGTLNASSAVAEGGRIWLKAKKDITLTSTSVLDVSGKGGGEIIALADNSMYVDGTLNASAPVSGDGGFIETSGKNRVKISESVFITTAAAHGKTGTWLIDPADFVIGGAGADAYGGTIGTTLGTTNVVFTSDDGGSGVNGDIWVNDAIGWNSGNSLTLAARRDVNVNATITNSGAGGLNLYAGWNGAAITPGSNPAVAVVPGVGDINITQAISVGNIINLKAGNQVLVAGAVQAGNSSGDATINISGGSITIDAPLKALGGNGSYGGGAGGDGVVNLVATGGVTVNNSIEARGGNGDSGGGFTAGGRGGHGKIMLSAGGSVVIDSGLTALGGNGGYYSGSAYGAGAGGDAIIQMTAANAMTIYSDVQANGGLGVGGGAANIQLSAVNGITADNAWISAGGGNGLSSYGGTPTGGAASVQLIATNGAINIIDGGEVYASGGSGGQNGSVYAPGGAASVKFIAGNGILIDGAEYGYVQANGGSGGTGGTATVELINTGASASVQILNNAYVSAQGGGDGSEGGAGGNALAMVSSAGGITISDSELYTYGGSANAYGGNSIGGAAGVTMLAGGNIQIDGAEGAVSALGGSGTTGGNAAVNVIAGGNITVDSSYLEAYSNGNTSGVASVVLAAASNVSLLNGTSIYTSGVTGLGGANILLDDASVSGNTGVAVSATGNLDLMSGSYLGTNSGIAYVNTGGNVTLNDSSRIYAPDVMMSVGGVINMNSGSTIGASLPSTIHLTFPTLTSGGYFVNGIEGVVYDEATFTGFCSPNCPAILGTNLLVTYGGGAALNIPTDALIVAMGESSKPPDPEKDKNVFEDIEESKKKDAPVCR